MKKITSVKKVRNKKQTKQQKQRRNGSSPTKKPTEVQRTGKVVNLELEKILEITIKEITQAKIEEKR